jgi:tetratricopeptide (TPR) repeat protein
MNKLTTCCVALVMSSALVCTAQGQTRPSMDEQRIKEQIDRCYLIYREGNDLTNTGNAAAGEAKLRQAMEIALELLAKVPDHPKVKLTVCACLDKFAYARFARDPTGNLAEVMQYAQKLETMLSMIPEDTENKSAYMRLGVYHRFKGVELGDERGAENLRKSAEHLEHAAAIDFAARPSENQRQGGGMPGDPPAQWHLPVIYEQLSIAYSLLKHWPEAHSACRQLQRLEPANPDVYRQFADIYFRQDRIPEVSAKLLQAILTGDVTERTCHQLREIYRQQNIDPDGCVVMKNGKPQLNFANGRVYEDAANGYRDLIRAALLAGQNERARTLWKEAVEQRGMPRRMFDELFTEPFTPPSLPAPRYYRAK